MIKNYLKVAFRALRRNKSYTFLNGTGLAVGIGACLLIFLLVQFELSFDNFHPDRDRIYRLVSVPFRAGSPLGMEAGVPLAVARALRVDFPQLEKVGAIFGRDAQVTVLDAGHSQGPAKKFNEEGGVFFAEPSFFDIFRFGWLAGDAHTALASPNTVVLSRETATNYFGDWKKSVGRTIKFDNKDIYTVTGILQDVPANTDFPLKLVVSYLSLKNVDLTDWQGTYGRAYTFVRLPPGLTASRFNVQLRDFVNRHTAAGIERRGVVLQPLAEMHSDGRFGNYRGRTFSRELTTSLGLTAAFLLLIACANFINLATAQAVKRSQEVGIRKVLGGTRGQLIRQFLGEAGMITVLAVVAAVCIARMVLPLLNALLDTSIRLRLNDPSLVAFLGLVIVAVTLMAGLYPAFVLSGFNPVSSLKNKLTASGGIHLRRGLVMLQFCIAQVFIVCVMVVSSQMNYWRHVSLGFDKASIVNVPIPEDSISLAKIGALRQELLRVPGVQRLSFSTFSPLDNEIWSNQFFFDHSRTKTDFQAYFKWADADFFKTYNPVLLAGRVYGPSDTLREFVVNETLVKKLGLQEPKDILGKEISFWDKRALVVGVLKDFQTNSMQTAIKPIIMGTWKDNYAVAGIKLKSTNVRQTLAAIERIWNAAYPDHLYSYQFLDDKIDGYYKEEDKLSLLYRIFAGIALFISCIGLYGLVSFMAAQRTREVGVRKVLGASVMQLMVLLSREFTVLIGIAFLVAAPVAYYLMRHWLDGFAYRIHLGVGLFLLSVAMSIVIAWCTVGFRAFRAAVANPVSALRSE